MFKDCTVSKMFGDREDSRNAFQAKTVAIKGLYMQRLAKSRGELWGTRCDSANQTITDMKG